MPLSREIIDAFLEDMEEYSTMMDRQEFVMYEYMFKKKES